MDRDDLRDGGAQHFADCIREARAQSPNLEVEILTPDFRGRMDVALDILEQEAPDVFNHNLKRCRVFTVSRVGCQLQMVPEVTARIQKTPPRCVDQVGPNGGLG